MQRHNLISQTNAHYKYLKVNYRAEMELHNWLFVGEGVLIIGTTVFDIMFHLGGNKSNWPRPSLW